jgi:hypothetical protein
MSNQAKAEDALDAVINLITAVKVFNLSKDDEEGLRDLKFDIICKLREFGVELREIPDERT